MKTWGDFERQSRDLWRQNEITQAALALMADIMKQFGERTIASASNTSPESVAETRFYAGAHDAMRRMIDMLNREAK